MKKNNAIEFLKGYYSEDIIAQACAYCGELYSDTITFPKRFPIRA